MTKPNYQQEESFPLPIEANEVVSADNLALRLRPLSAVAARKAISRAAQDGLIWRTEHLQLPGGGRLYARKSFAGQERFLNQIRPLLKKRPGIARVLDAMLRVPAIHEDTLKKLLAATLDSETYPEQRSFEDETLVLHELGIGKLDHSQTGRSRFVRPSLFETDESAAWGDKLAGDKLLDQQLTKLLLLTFRRQNLVSWAYEPKDGLEHQFNGQWFSAHTNCWLRPMLTTKKGEAASPCPVVFDVRASAASVLDVEAFATRIKNAGYRPRSSIRILGIMAARYFEPEAFILGKQHGFVLVNFHEEIGNDALDALAAIEQIVTAPDRPKGKKPDFIDIFTKLKHHPQVKELASLAFESFTSAVAQAQGWSNVHTNLAVKFGDKDTGTWRDVDVSGQRGDHHLAIECKAYSRNKSLEISDVSKFFKQTAPSYLKHFSQQKKIRSLTAELWTTGQISKDCSREFEMLKNSAKPNCHYALRQAQDIEIPTSVRSLEKLLVSIAGL